MKSLWGAVEAGANVAILAVAVLIGWTVVQRQCPSESTGAREGARKPITPAIGSNLPLRDSDWSQVDRTLVMVLASRCRFCLESQPFYKRLSQLAAEGQRIQLLAVLPDTPEDSRRYLESLDVRVSSIRNLPLGTLQVSATPTLILVDRSGVVKRVWVGKLSTAQEQEVIAGLSGSAS